MPTPGNRWQHEPAVFAPDTRPGADAYVYCKGCGQPLVDQPRNPKMKVVVTTMMCDACQERYQHKLAPPPDAPSFCYRCGGPDEIFVEEGISPATYRVCPRCLPERAARYRAGDFETPKVTRGADPEPK
jgi:NMD protein affecting ribosome stability and mRNA decay